MKHHTLLSTFDDFSGNRDTPEYRLKHLQSLPKVLFSSLGPRKRTELWLSLIPESFQLEITSFYKTAKMSDGVNVFDRHKIKVDNDTLFLSHLVNTSKEKGLPLITNTKLALMRNMIYLYLSFSRNADYGSGWSFISYIITTLDATEEENFLLFAYLIQHILSNFFASSENYAKKLECISNFYLLIDAKRFTFANSLHNAWMDKSVKTLPNYSTQIPKKKKTTVASYFNLAKIFNKKPASSTTSIQGNMMDSVPCVTNPSEKATCEILTMKSEYIDNLPLFALIQAISEEWFGMLFANVLKLQDCLELWDYLFMHGTDFLFQFGLSLIINSESNLLTVMKRGREQLEGFDTLDPQLVYFALNSSFKQVLMTSLNRDEFLVALSTAKEKSLEKFVKEKSEEFIKRKIKIAGNFSFERLRHLVRVKKELMSYISFTRKQIEIILKRIEKREEKELFMEDLTELLKKEGINSLPLIMKIFSLVDLSLKGYVEKRELKIFFLLLVNGSENKMQLLWNEIDNQEIEIETHRKLAKTANPISADDGIKLLQIVERFVSPHSIEVDEEVGRIYQAWLQRIKENYTTIDNFIHFVQTSEECNLLRTSLDILDGKIAVDTKKSMSKHKIDEIDENLDDNLDSLSFIQFDEPLHGRKFGTLREPNNNIKKIQEVSDVMKKIEDENFDDHDDEGLDSRSNSFMDSARDTFKSLAKSLAFTKPKHISPNRNEYQDNPFKKSATNSTEKNDLITLKTYH